MQMCGEYCMSMKCSRLLRAMQYNMFMQNAPLKAAIIFEKKKKHRVNNPEETHVYKANRKTLTDE